MAVSSTTLTISPCSSNGPCCLTEEHLKKLKDINCMLLQLDHKVKCCATHAKGGNEGCTCGEGEVSAEGMRSVAEDVERSARQLLDDLRQHLDQRDLRANKGRAQRGGQTDSGVVSWTPDPANYPIPEVCDEPARPPTTGSRQPEENSLDSLDTNC